MDTKLIIQYLEGRIGKEQEKVLFEWLRDNPDNMRAFREIEFEWKLRHIPSPEAMQAVHAFREQIGHEKKGRKNFWKVFLSAVSVAAVVAGIFFATRQFVTEQIPEEVQWFFVEAPIGTHSRISLPDGTEVWLNAGSVLSYGSDFNTKDRNINLNGEAYFEVAHNPDKPFIVNAKDCRFTVLGTEFNINAYEEDSIAQVALIEGSLKFDGNGGQEIMTPGDMITWSAGGSTFVKEKVNASQYRAWIDGIILYDNITLPVLLKRLSREYAVNIILETERFNSKSFRVSYTDGESVDAILSSISRIVPIRVTIREGKYYVDAK